MAPYRALEEHLPQRTKRVLETLLRLHRANESLCLSFDAIATAAGVPRGTAVGAIEKLADLGVVTIHIGGTGAAAAAPTATPTKSTRRPYRAPKRKRSVERAAAAIAENPARSNCAIAGRRGPQSSWRKYHRADRERWQAVLRGEVVSTAVTPHRAPWLS
jgi:hypothetical protein